MNKEKNKYLIVAIVLVLLFVTGCATKQFVDEAGNTTMLPLASDSYGIGGSLDFLVFPMAWLMFTVGKVVGYNYALMILIVTIVVRSIAWPIYGKSNDMTMKMNLLAPEQRKIEEKYAGKNDKESQQRKSMEMMNLYKKYKISFTGCLMPFVQMPIFLAFYETLRRIPVSSQNYLNTVGNTFIAGEDKVIVNEVLYNADILKTKFLGLNLLEGAGSEWNWQRIGIYLLAVLVAVTQLGQQLLTQRRSNKQKAEMDSNVPEYRKKAPTDQQKQTEMMMKIMLYAMPVMMAVFIITNTAALGWYWFVGNIFTAFQSFISSKTSAKKLEALRQKYSNNNSLY